MPIFSFIRAFCPFICLVFFFPCCNYLDNSEKNTVISVGKRHLDENELQKEIERIIFEMGITDQEAKYGIKSIINKVIEKNLIIEYGNAEKIVLSDEELDHAIKDIKKAYTDDVFKEMLLKKYIDFDKWKEGLRQDLLLEKIISKAVEDIPPVANDEIKEYFYTHRDEFRRPQMVKLRQVVVRSEKEAKEVLERLKSGESMEELARKYSISPEAEDGGVLGWIEKGELEDPIEKVVFSLPVGKTSKIIESSYGYHVFEALSRLDEGFKELPEVMTEVESKLLLAKKELFFKEWVRGLWDRFPVTVKKDIYNYWTTEGQS